VSTCSQCLLSFLSEGLCVYIVNCFFDCSDTVCCTSDLNGEISCSCINIVQDETFVSPQVNHSRKTSLSVLMTKHINAPVYNVFLILLLHSHTSRIVLDVPIHLQSVMCPFISKIFHDTFSKIVLRSVSLSVCLKLSELDCKFYCFIISVLLKPRRLVFIK